MNTFEDLADRVRSAVDNSDAARIIEDFVTEYGCSIAEKNEFNIANVSVQLPTVKDVRSKALEYAKENSKYGDAEGYTYARIDFIEGAEWMRTKAVGN